MRYGKKSGYGYATYTGRDGRQRYTHQQALRNKHRCKRSRGSERHRRTCLTLLIFVTLVAAARPTVAWEVDCITRAGWANGARIACKTDQDRLTGFWDGEHATLCRKTLERAGIRERVVSFHAECRHRTTGRPAMIYEVTTDAFDCSPAMDVKHYVGMDYVYAHCSENGNLFLVPNCGSFTKEGIFAWIKDSPTAKALCELAELPDFAFGLNDYASRFQAPPPVPGPGHHDYKTRIGVLNSTHFGDQASAMYRHYHGLAISVAGRCKKNYEIRPDHLKHSVSIFDRHATECEALSLGIEAVAQHYLEDRWAVGHMWQRWGSPRPNDFPNVETGILIAAITGFIHGVKAVLPTAEDPLNAPADFVRWGFPDGKERYPGVGDLYLDHLLTDPQYKTQLDWLMTCGAAGFREVYNAGPRMAGTLESAGAASVVEKCLTPLVTNEALSRSATITAQPGNDMPDKAVFDLFDSFSFAKELHAKEAYKQLMAALAKEAVQDPGAFTLASGIKMPKLFGVSAGTAFTAFVPPSYGDKAWPWPNIIGDHDQTPMADLMTSSVPTFYLEFANSVDWSRLSLLQSICVASGEPSTVGDLALPTTPCGRCIRAWSDNVHEVFWPPPTTWMNSAYGSTPLNWGNPVCDINDRSCKSNPNQCVATHLMADTYCHGQIDKKRTRGSCF